MESIKYNIIGIPSGQIYEVEDFTMQLLLDFQLAKYKPLIDQFVFKDKDEKIIKCYIDDEEREKNVF